MNEITSSIQAVTPTIQMRASSNALATTESSKTKTSAMPAAAECSCLACQQLNAGATATPNLSDQQDGANVAEYSAKGLMTQKKSAPHDRATEERKTEATTKLKERDREVRTHEAAHIAAAGGLAQGGPKFTYQRGPDGQLYAIGGSVSIDIKPVDGDPKATMDKARVIRAAALAPAEPSGQDQAVAAAAAQMAQKARQEISQQNTETPDSDNGSRAAKSKVSSGSGKSGTTKEHEQSFNNSSTATTSGKLSVTTFTQTLERRLQTAITAAQSTNTMFMPKLDIHV